MSASEAQIVANRKNSARSCGPKTVEGKAQSRRNGLKHGMTGEGIVLLREDEEAVARLTATLEAEMNPGTTLGQILLGRVASMAIRVQKSEKQESAAIAQRVRQAPFVFEDERLAEVDQLFADLDNDPVGSVRKLRRTPEGVDRLIVGWEALRDRLFVTGRNSWQVGDRACALRLCGEKPGRFGSVVDRISRAALGDFSILKPHEGAGLDDPARQVWAVGRMVELVDTEISGLRALLATFGDGFREMERAEAAEIAVFDPAKPAVLARKYEAASERNLYRALREFRQVEAEAAEASVSHATSEPQAVCEELASSFPETEVEVVETEPEPLDRPERVEIEPILTPNDRLSSVQGSNDRGWERPAAA